MWAKIYRKTSRPLEVRIKEHNHNLKQGLLEKSKLIQHAYEEGHRIKSDEAKVIQKEPSTIYRKYEECSCGLPGEYDQSTLSGDVTHLAAHHQRRD
jgi:hypothetical protein